MITGRVWKSLGIFGVFVLVGSACFFTMKESRDSEEPWWGPPATASDRLSINGIYLGTLRGQLQESLPTTCRWSEFNEDGTRILIGSGTSQVLVSFSDSSPEAEVVGIEAESDAVLRVGTRIVWRNGEPASSIAAEMRESRRPLTYVHGNEAVGLKTLWNGQVVAVQLERSDPNS